MYIYIQSIFVYVFTAWIMMFLSKQYVITRKYIYVICAIAIYAIVFGFRYGVGSDFFGYLHDFDAMVKYGELDKESEAGFTALMKFLSYFKSSTFFFGVIAFLQLFLVTFVFQKKRYIYPVLFFTFMFLGTWLNYSNGLRQVLAACIWTYSLKFAIEKRPFLHYLLILLAISMHQSAFLLIPFYPIIRLSNNWFKKPLFELALVASCLFLSRINIVQMVVQKLDMIIALLGYDTYLDISYVEFLNADSGFGLGFIIQLVIAVMVILYSEKVKTFVNSDFYNILYSLYVVGVLLSYLFTDSPMMLRLTWYFNVFSFAIVAFTLYYFKGVKKKLHFFLLGSLVVLVFVAIIYKASSNCALFVFNWQDQFFILHKYHDF